MKHRLIRLACLLLIIVGLSGYIGTASNSEVLELSYPNRYWEDFKNLNRPAGRTLSSIASTHDTALIAALDGTIHLVESNSRNVLWSFTSGPSIYSSYQAPVNEDNDKENASGPSSGFFVDCGDDWELYAHTKHFGKMKLSMTVEEFISSTPHISEDGGVTLGSKKTTVFLVDAKTGRLIYTYQLSNSPSTLQSDEEKSVLYNKNIEDWVESGSMNPKNVELPLYITRTDYLLQSFVPNSDKVLWNMTVAEIGAAFLCQDTENPLDGAPLNSGFELGSESGSHFDMPLPCQSKAVVYRFHTRNMLEYFSRPDRLPEAHHEDVMLPMSDPNRILPLQPKADKFLEFHHDNAILSVPATNNMLPSQPKIDKFLDLNRNNSDIGLPLTPSEINNSGISDVHDVRKHYNDDLNMFSKWSVALSIVLFIVILVGFVIRHYALAAGEQVELNKQLGDSNAKTVPSKKKKIRKSGKNNGSVEKKEESDDGFACIQSDNKAWLNLNKLVDGGADGRRIGKLFVSNKEIAKGSNGTIVLEGIYAGRPVAVKRLVQSHHDVAFKEIQNLIASDQHPNIVRWYGVEYDQDFVYLSLERCTCSLDDLIQVYSDSSQNPVFTEEQASRSMIEYKVRLDSISGIMRDINLWKANGYPSPQLLQLMRDVVSGLVHLHELGIIHRDLKPQNVLIIKERSLCAKLSDMGISRRLLADMSSLDHHATGCGSSGWQAPEQLLHGRQTRALDLFSLGCVLFYCITGGRHPFGDRLERDVNIVKNQVDLFLVEYIPEAVDLFSHLLNPDPELRPKALEVVHHPLFWSSEMRLSFFRDTSDRVEMEDRESNSGLLKALESIAPMALGVKWDEKMEPAFIANIGHYRRYKFDSIRDLLRVMRNKLNHYRELPKEIQEILGPVPEGFDGYFANRFPKLLIEVYKVVYRYCKEEECFEKYLKSNA